VRDKSLRRTGIECPGKPRLSELGSAFQLAECAKRRSVRKYESMYLCVRCECESPFRFSDMVWSESILAHLRVCNFRFCGFATARSCPSFVGTWILSRVGGEKVEPWVVLGDGFVSYVDIRQDYLW
jgi:hypothetical protein